MLPPLYYNMYDGQLFPRWVYDPPGSALWFWDDWFNAILFEFYQDVNVSERINS